jgi:hypothetical protein
MAQNENWEAELARQATAAAADYVEQRRAGQAVPSAFASHADIPGEKNVVAFRQASFSAGDDDRPGPGGNRKKKKSS